MMTNATTHRQFNPGRPPLLGLAAILATAATLGAAVLLPAQHVPYASIAAIQPVAAQAPTQIVTLPPVEVIGTRTTKAARNERWAHPVLFRKNG
jgi:hypothetical protein